MVVMRGLLLAKKPEKEKIIIYHYQLLIFAETILRQLWVENEKKPSIESR